MNAENIISLLTEHGQIIVENLDWGVYKLVETVADGYILPADPNLRTYTFRFSPAA